MRSVNQVLFACNNAYCINEKKAIKLLETFEYKPKKYAERVNHIFEILGLSLFECYDMTEKLYKEVKKLQRREITFSANLQSCG